MTPVGRPSQRSAALNAAFDLLRDGKVLSLESVAQATGMTKPGLMYHFSTKQALLAAVLDLLLERHERHLLALLPDGTNSPTARERLVAYLKLSITRQHDAADLVVFSDPKLRVLMAARWADHFRAWLDIPADLPDDERSRLQAVRLIAEGCWFADAADILPIPESDRPSLLTAALSLLDDTARDHTA